MGITQHTSGNLNDVRAYPFADTASRVDADGAKLPEWALNDCHLWWPAVYGELGFVSTITVSPRLVTATFAAYRSETGVTTPIAVLHVVRPEETYRSYALVAMQPGVGGWAAVGQVPPEQAGVQTWRFTTPTDAELLRRVAQAYADYPMSTVGKLNVLPVLQGDVTLLSGGNMEISEEYRYINSRLSRCIVFALPRDQLPALYELYAGPCGKRPESNTCDRQALRMISGVKPDSLGRIFLQVDDTNGVVMGELDDPGGIPVGVALQTNIELGDVCETIDDFPAIYPDLCPVSSSFPMLSSAISEFSSSSLYPYVGLSSSSAGAQSVFYDFALDTQSVADFSLFQSQGVWKHDWRLDSLVSEDPGDVRWQGGPVVPFPRHSSLASFDITTHLVNNRYFQFVPSTMPVYDNNAWIELEVQYKLLASELHGIGAAERRVVALRVSNSRFATSSLQQDSIRLEVKYDNQMRAYVQLISRNATTDTPRSDLVVRERPNWDALHETLILRVRRSTSQNGEYECTYEYRSEAEFNRSSSAVRDESSSSTILENDRVSGSTTFVESSLGALRFGGVMLDSIGVLTEVSPVDFYWKNFRISGDKVQKTRCSAVDFSADTIQHALSYDPSAGWSNDFGTGRALDQFTRYDEDDMVPRLTQKDGGLFVYPRQMLEVGGGTKHKYAVLDCETSSLNYYFSAAFRWVSGNPRFGISLGWQGDSDRTFWGMMLWPQEKKMTYGIHYLPNSFSPSAPSSWLDDVPRKARFDRFAWHRIVANITQSGSVFTIKAWIDPETSLLSSSATMNTPTKRITVDALDPDFQQSGLFAWTGATNPPLSFADGNPGVYVFGGNAQVAEFTASPQGQDIIVPNKVPWLDV